jgi:hypothetical protein
MTAGSAIAPFEGLRNERADEAVPGGGIADDDGDDGHCGRGGIALQEPDVRLRGHGPLQGEKQRAKNQHQIPGVERRDGKIPHVRQTAQRSRPFEAEIWGLALQPGCWRGFYNGIGGRRAVLTGERRGTWRLARVKRRERWALRAEIYVIAKATTRKDWLPRGARPRTQKHRG